MADVITTLKRFVHVEYEAQARQLYEMWRQPLNARIAEGEAIADVKVVQTAWNGAVLLCRDNLSKFRAGDSLRLNRGDPESSDILRCELLEDRGTELIIRPQYGTNFIRLSPGGGWVLDRDMVDTRQILLGALDTLAFLPDWQRYILGILGGSIKPRHNWHREQRAASEAGRLGLKSSQCEAFSQAFAAENYYLIQGPPGTGKTWVLAYLATALAAEGQRVLVTAFTHRAINNALCKIARTTGYNRILKVGQHHYAEDLTWDGGSVHNYERFGDSPYSPQEQGLIIGGTCFAVRSSRLRDIQFDTIIFDEAGQVTLPLAISAMLSGPRYIFIGDHKQMAPVIAGEHREKWVTRSVFETLFEHVPGTMLDITYRMNAEINDFPSRHFYGGRLKPSADARQQRLKLNGKPQRYAALLDPAYPSIFAEVRHTNKGMRSAEEAEIAAGVAAEAIACGVSPKEIAVVAPYRAQGRLIRKHLQELASDFANDSFADIVVDTVERIQGQERDMVIISLTTSDPVHAAKRAEFYFQPNRLNVAIIRPKVKRIVIGSPLLFTAQPPLKEHQEWVEHFRALYEESHIVPVPL